MELRRLATEKPVELGVVVYRETLVWHLSSLNVSAKTTVWWTNEVVTRRANSVGMIHPALCQETLNTESNDMDVSNGGMATPLEEEQTS